MMSRVIEPSCLRRLVARAGVLSAISGRLLRFVRALASSIEVITGVVSLFWKAMGPIKYCRELVTLVLCFCSIKIPREWL